MYIFVYMDHPLFGVNVDRGIMLMYKIFLLCGFLQPKERQNDGDDIHMVTWILFLLLKKPLCLWIE